MVQWHLNVRRELTEARTRVISVARAITRSQGFGFRWRDRHVLDPTRRVGSPGVERGDLAPVRSLMELLNEELADADATL